jgi:uncharacterized protein (TIRG00374 family)
MGKAINNIIRGAIGLVFLLILFYKVDFAKVSETILGLDISYVPFIVLLFCLFLLLNVLNFFILSSSLVKDVSFKPVLRCSLLSWGYGKFFPAGLGEFSFAYFLRKHGVIPGQSTAVVLVDKVITFMILFAVAFFGLSIVLRQDSATYFLLLVAICLLFALVLVFSSFGRSVIKRFILRKYSPIFTGFSKSLFYLLKSKWASLFVVAVITALRWAIGFFITYLIFRSLGLDVPYLVLAGVMSVTSISALIPISIGGLGVRESVGVVLFLQYGIPGHMAAAAMLLDTALSYLFATTIVCLHLFQKD